MSESQTGLSGENLKTAFLQVIDDEHVPHHLVDCLVAEVTENISEVIDELQLGALDPSVVEKGGMVFLWDDVLSVGDAFDILDIAIDDFSPVEAARLLIRFALAWRKLRGVRVKLNELEFRVLAAVKKGANSMKELSNLTGYKCEEINSIVNELKVREYRTGIYLLEGEDGSLSTKF